MSEHTPDWNAISALKQLADMGHTRLTGEQKDMLELVAQRDALLAALQSAERALNNIRVCCIHTAWDATGPAVIEVRAAIKRATE